MRRAQSIGESSTVPWARPNEGQDAPIQASHPLFSLSLSDSGSDSMNHAKLIFGHGGGRDFGNSWAELDALLAAHGAVIAHGHITSIWRDRFPGDYGSLGEGPIPHFIAVFRATAEGEVVVCDPMH